MQSLPLDAIRIDGGTQSRAEIDTGTVDDYAEEQQAGVQFPPIDVFFDGSDYWLAEGFHRYLAALRSGLSEIKANVRQGTVRDAILFAVGSNARHGLRRTNADKRHAIMLLLEDEEWSERSDRWIAETCAVSPSTVGAVRNELSKLDSCSNGQPKKGRDGKTRRRSPSATVDAVDETEGEDCAEDCAEDDCDLESPQSDLKGTSPSIVKDAIGRDVPPHLSNEHAAAAAINSAANRLDAIKREVMQLADEPGGQFIEASALEADFKMLKGRIAQSRYWSECPRCRGTVKPDCKRCNGNGFIPFFKRGMLSDAEKEWLGVD